MNPNKATIQESAGRALVARSFFICIVLGMFTVPSIAISVPIADFGYIPENSDSSLIGPFGNNPSGFGLLVGRHDQDGSIGTAAEEARVTLEFDISSLTTPVPSAFFSFPAVNVLDYGVSSCFNFSSCPKLPVLDAYGYVADGAVTTDDFDPADSTFLAAITTPQFGELITIDLTDYMNNLISAGGQYLGLLLRPASGEEGVLATGPFERAAGDGQTSISIGDARQIPLASTLALVTLGAGLLFGLRGKLLI